MRDSPTFVWNSPTVRVTRMSVFSPLKKLDVERGVRLAKHAYRSRKGQDPPAIVAARFEQGGQMLAAYNAIDLEEDEAPL